MLKSDDHVNPNSYQTNFMYSAGIFDVYSIAFYIFILISFVQPGSHCILKWGGGVHLVLFLILYPPCIAVYRGLHHFGGGGYKPNFGGKKNPAEGKWECCSVFYIQFKISM